MVDDSRVAMTHHPPDDVVEIHEGADGWYWIFRNDPAGRFLRSNDDWPSLEAALRSARVAYPDLDPVVSHEPSAHEDADRRARRPEVSRAAELRKLLGVAAGIAFAAGVAWLKRRGARSG